jgi:hypothetical protein
MRRKFIIEYDSDKPLLKHEHFLFEVNPKYIKTNLEMLKGLLQVITDTIELTPIKK